MEVGRFVAFEDQTVGGVVDGVVAADVDFLLGGVAVAAVGEVNFVALAVWVPGEDSTDLPAAFVFEPEVAAGMALECNEL